MLIRLARLALFALLAGQAARAESLEDVEPTLGALDSAAFRLRALVKTFVKNKFVSANWLDESYSSEQSRAIIRHKLVKGQQADESQNCSAPLDEAGTLFLDTQMGFMLAYGSGSGSCQLVPTQGPTGMDRLLQLELIAHDKQRQQPAAYFRGAAKWLLFVARNRDLFKVADLEKDTAKRVRNVRCTMYTHQRAGAKVTAYFADKSLAEHQKDALPMRVSIETETRLSMIEFSQFQQIGHSLAEATLGQERLVADHFALEPLSGCSPLLARTNIRASKSLARTIYEPSGAGQTPSVVGVNEAEFGFNMRFSFRAHVELQQSARLLHSYRTSVAYDAPSGLLRVDVDQSTGSVFRSKQVFDFMGQTQYHCLESSQRHGPLVNQLLELGASNLAEEEEEEESVGRSAERPSGACLRTRMPAELVSECRVANANVLLVGADLLVYLGRARVRGISARAYELVDGELPYWLEPALGLWDRTTRARATWRAAREWLKAWADSAGSPSRLVTLVYVSADNERPPARLLRLEFLHTDSAFRAVRERRTVDLYDFVWHFERRTSDGRTPTLELFALAQATSARAFAGEPVERAQVRMLLASERALDSMESQLLGHKMGQLERDSAFLGGLQRELQLPQQMIFDFSSKLVPHSPEFNSSAQLVALTFEYARHVFDELRLERVGVATRILTKSWHFQAISFVDCALLAGQQRVPLYFAYEPRDRHCYVEAKSKLSRPSGGQVDESANGPTVLPFEILPNNKLRYSTGTKLQVFSLTHSLVTAPSLIDLWHKSADEENEEQGLRERGSFKERKSDTRNKLLVFSSEPLTVNFKVVKLNMVNVHKRMPNKEEQKSRQAPAKLQGFGLIEQKPISERLDSVPLLPSFIDPLGRASGRSSDQLGAMSLELCRSTCMGDLECKSYSICVRRGQLECILSRADFRSAKLLAKLDQITSARSLSFGEQLSLALEGDKNSSVRLVRHQLCSIYNKHYLDYFQLERLPASRAIRKIVFQTADLEQCASWCAWYNFKAIRGHYSRLGDQLAGLAEGLAAERLTSEQGGLSAQELESQVEPFRLTGVLSKDLCRQLIYINPTSLETQPVEFKQRLDNYVKRDLQWMAPVGERKSEANGDQLGGYCILPSDVVMGAQPNGGRPVLEPQPELDLDLSPNSGRNSNKLNLFALVGATFKLQALYEETRGVSLRRSNMSLDEYQVFGHAHLLWRGASAKQANLLMDFAKRGENNQLVKQNVGAAVCAQWCFLSAAGPWPGCRSFDVLTKWTRDSLSSSNKSLLYCQLNSITLNQAISFNRMDLIETSAAKDSLTGEHVLERRHFEPRPGFALELSMLGGERELFQLLEQQNEPPASSRRLAHLMAISLVLLLAVSSGLYAGIWLTSLAYRPIIDRRASRV